MAINTVLIKKATLFTPEIAEAVRKLAQQIGNNFKPLSDDDIQRMILSPNHNLLLAHDEDTNKIVGMIMLLTYRIPYVKKATMEDLIVDEHFRNKGIGKLLIEKAIALAKEEQVAYIDFTSRPRRAEGNNLYEKLGFKKRETNVYRFINDYAEV